MFISQYKSHTLAHTSASSPYFTGGFKKWK